jgi:hypothetical protein
MMVIVKATLKLFNRLAMVLICALPTLAVAQQTQPYKLVIASSEGGITVVDYPSAIRCERARVAIEADMQRRTDEANARTAPGAIITSYGWRARTLCIPG